MPPAMPVAFVLLFGDIGTGCPFDQLRMEQQGSDMHIVQLVQHSIETTLANVDPVLTDGGQCRESKAAHGNIVKADNADILGNPITHLSAVDHNAVGQ